jgi:predicted MFS family arabinose efflux permease
MKPLSGRPLVLAMALGEIGTLLPSLSFAALTPLFIGEWQITNAEAGWIAGISAFGYMVAVTFLMSLTDRIDARRVYLVGAALSLFSILGFALAAHGFWSGLIWRALGGVGLAGTYMPGLKILTDRHTGADKSRSVSFYTASYAVGVSLSYLFTGLLSDAYGWRAGIGLLALGPLAALLIAWFGVGPMKPAPGEGHRLLNFRPVFANRQALGYILAYGAHGFELVAVRAWLVAFLGYAALRAGLAGDHGATAIAAVFSVIGLPASVLGNELALRFGRRRVLIRIMSISAALSAGLGFAGGLPYAVVVGLILIYGVTLTADSGALTSGVVASASPDAQGATIAVHSSIGFASSFLVPLAAGLALDAGGGQAAPLAWTMAFLVIGLGAALGPLALWLLGRPEARN